MTPTFKHCVRCHAEVFPAMVKCRDCGTPVGSPPPVVVSEQPAAIKDDGKIRTSCPRCNKRIKARIEFAGKDVRCPRCTNAVSLPKLTAEQQDLYRSMQLLQNLTDSRPGEEAEAEHADDTSFEINLPSRTGDTSRELAMLSSVSGAPLVPSATDSIITQPPATADSIVNPGSAVGTTIRAICGACGREATAPVQFAGLVVPCEACAATVRFPDRVRSAEASSSSNDGPMASTIRARREVDLLRAIDGALKLPENIAPLQPVPFRQPLSSSVTRKHLKAIAKAVAAGESTLSDDVREALSALGENRVDSAAGDLLRHFDAAQSEVKLALLICLAELKHPPAYPVLLRYLGAARAPEIPKVIDGLLAFGDVRGALPLILAGDIYPHLQRQIHDGIVAWGGAVGNHLCRLVPEITDSFVLVTIARLLGRFQGSCPIKTFRHLLKNPDVEVRRAAASSLTSLADGASVPQLVRSMRDEDESVRALLAQAFPRCANEEGVAGLMKYVDDPSPKVRRSVIRALGACGLGIPLALIRTHLDDPDLECRIASAEAIGRLGDPTGLTRLIEILKSQPVSGKEGFARPIAAAFGRMKDPRGMLPLLNLLMSDDVPLKVQVATSLGELGQKVAREPLERLLSREQAEPVRVAAAKSLGELGDNEARAALELALRDTAPVQIAAIKALATLRCRKSEIVDTLRPVLLDPKPTVRMEVLHAFIALRDGELIDDVLPLLVDENVAVQRLALRTLRELGDTRDDHVLQKLAKRHAPSGQTQNPTGSRPAKASPSGKGISLPKLSIPSWLTSMTPAVLVGALVNPIALGGISVAALLVLAVVFMGNPFGFQPERVVPRGYVSCVSVSDDGKWLAAARNRGLLEIWDIQQNKIVNQTSSLPVSRVCFGPKAQNLLCVSGKRMVLMPLNNGTFGEPIEMQGHEGAVIDLQTTPDHKFCVTLGSDNSIMRWDLENGKATSTILAETDVNHVSISSDGHEVAATGKDGSLILWDMDTKAEIGRAKVDKAQFVAVAIQADGPLVAAGTRDGKVILCDPTKPADIQIDDSSSVDVKALNFPAGGHLYVVRGSAIELRDVTAGTQVVLQTDLETISTLAVDGQGKLISVGNDEESPVLVFEPSSQKLLHELDKS